MKKMIVWDWNGTLLDDVRESIDSVNPTLAKRGLPTLSLERYYEVFDFPIREYYRAIGFIDDNIFDEAAYEYIDIYSTKQFHLAHDAKKTLETIKKLGINQMILTASKIENFINQAKPLDVLQYFDYTLGLNDIFAKSKKELFIQWLNEHNIDKQDILIVGDTRHDYQIAHELDIDCIICVGHGHQPASRFAEYNVKIIQELSEIIAILKNND